MNISNFKKDKTLNIWVLTDGKLGHANQTEGLVEALANALIALACFRIPPM